jgi:hypothetical protein
MMSFICEAANRIKRRYFNGNTSTKTFENDDDEVKKTKLVFHKFTYFSAPNFGFARLPRSALRCQLLSM